MDNELTITKNMTVKIDRNKLFKIVPLTEGLIQTKTGGINKS